MGFKFPYGQQQQLNLNWFIKKFKELLVDWQREKESIDGALDAEIQRAEDALSDVYTARDVTVAAKNDALQAKADALTAAANAAQYWQNAAASANSAATSAVTALQAAQDAANDADQTSRDRASVTADKAAIAADKAAVAADKAAVAADKAAVAQDKDDVDTLKDAANAAALRSEGWAVGEQNGTPVASGSPYYENNSKYFKEQAEDVLNSIPADYTELSNDVDELKDDVEELKANAGDISQIIENVNIAAFSDAANAPIKNLVVDFDAGETAITGTTIRRANKNLMILDRPYKIGGLSYSSAVGDTFAPSISSEGTYSFEDDIVTIHNNNAWRGVAFASEPLKVGTYRCNISSITKTLTGSAEAFDMMILSKDYKIKSKLSHWSTITVPQNWYWNINITEDGDFICCDIGGRSGTYITITLKDIRLVVGNVSSEYQRPNTTSYPISWQNEAGAITSGKITVSPLGAVTLETSGTTYQLASITPITTHEDNNTIWCVDGVITYLEYLADSGTYIDTRDKLIKALIAVELSEMTADTALTPNDFRIVNNTLYRITANIAAGATLTPNTNCVATTVADVLKTLL